LLITDLVEGSGVDGRRCTLRLGMVFIGSSGFGSAAELRVNMKAPG
jgi:hypothetical protein